MSEQVVLDPSELVTGDREELDITCWIDAEGVDWGDAQISAFLSEGRWGDVPVDYRTPNRQVQIPMVLKTVGGTTFTEIRSSLQQKISLFQREGGWIQRIYNGSTVYADVTDATLHATSWSGVMSRGSVDMDATLTLSCLPDWYGNEISLGVHSSLGDLTFTEDPIQGDIDARARIEITDLGSDHQKSLIYGFQSRYYNASDAAALSWEAEEWNIGGGVARNAYAWASGGTAVHDSTLGTAFSILAYTGGLASLSSSRVFARFYSPTSGAAQYIYSRLEWSADGEDSYVENPRVSITGGSALQLVDLGPVHVPQSPVGNRATWTAYIMASSDPAGADIAVDTVYIVPADHYSGVVADYNSGGTILFADRSAELRTEGYFRERNNAGGIYDEKPIYGDLPRIPVGGTVQAYFRPSQGIPVSAATDATDDLWKDDTFCNISAQIHYRPCWLFLGTA